MTAFASASGASKTAAAQENPIFIFGSASSGTTLLGVMLDRHSAVACGPELNVFDKRQLYGDYQTVRRNIGRWLKTGLLSDGQVDTPDFFREKEAYFIEPDQLVGFAQRSTSLREFCGRFFEHYLSERGKRVWVEKTGSNAYYRRQILELYPQARIIHITRDGRDVMCSIMARGDGPYHAASHWLYNNAAALTWSHSANYLRVQYEELVSRPEETLRRICEHIGHPFEPQMLEASDDRYWRKHAAENIHASWKATPFSGEISTRSVGRYKTELSPEDEEVFRRIRLTPFARRKLGTTCTRTAELMSQFGYEATAPRPAVRLPVRLCRRALHGYLARFRRNWKLNRSAWWPLTYVAPFRQDVGHGRAPQLNEAVR